MAAEAPETPSTAYIHAPEVIYLPRTDEEIERRRRFTIALAKEGLPPDQELREPYTTTWLTGGSQDAASDTESKERER
jgi:hypothetical protein